MKIWLCGKISAIFVFVTLIILASGCTLPWGVGDVIKISPNVEEVGYKDILLIKDLKTLPLPPLLPDQQFTLSFLLENQDETKSAENVVVNLFDPAIFKSESGSALTADEKTKEIGNILPLGQKQVSYKLRAPTQEEIANIIVKPVVSFKVNYDFQTTTTYDVVVVDEDEILRLQKAGQTITIPTTESIGSGPVKIDIELLGSNKVILAGQDAVIKVQIIDSGSGALKDSEIQESSLEVEIPDEFVIEELPPSELNPNEKMFSCGGSNIVGFGEATTICVNTEPISLYRGKSSPLIFRLSIPKDAAGGIYKTYSIKAGLEYTYELREQLKLEVKPYETSV